MWVQSSSVAKTIDEVANRLQHRGPDDFGLLHTGSTVLAHRRLSIIDIARGKQPLSNENGDLALVCNGEIYNHERLWPQPSGCIAGGIESVTPIS